MKMYRTWLVLAVLVVRAVWAQAPAYTADSIVNASDYSSGPFAPNSVLSIFGSNLSWYTGAFSASQSVTSVPVALSGVEVYVDNWPAPLLYVSPSQINFLIPSGESPGSVTVRVVREGASGPFVSLNLVDGAPALFETGSGLAIATHADGALLTDASPGQPGEVVVVYATGLGATDPDPEAGEIPETAAPLQWLSSLSISLNGAALPSALILYAGATPGCVGLYQLNIQLPQDVPADPVIQVSMGMQSNSGSLKIAVQ
jgi:uncharacterized protein (TIGR03437 family)